MPLTVPSPNASINSPEWRRFLLQLGQPAEDLQWYAGLKVLADANNIPIPGPSEPIGSGSTISTAWYPALQRLAAAI